jgi:hypothetical protein
VAIFTFKKSDKNIQKSKEKVCAKERNSGPHKHRWVQSASSKVSLSINSSPVKRSQQQQCLSVYKWQKTFL